MSIEKITASIVKTRNALGKLETYPGEPPADLAEAIAIQDAVVAGLGETVVGWKIGCTSETAQAALGTDGPFFGPVISSRFYASGGTVETASTSLRVVEPEIALRLGKDLPPRDKPYSVNEVVDAVATAHPSLEVIDRRLPGGFEDGVLWHVADCGLNDALILGPGTLEVPSEKLPELAVEARVNGKTISTGFGRNALNGPQHALHWIANTFSALGRTLEAGQVVTTGLVTGIFAVEPGDRVEAIYEDIGGVSARIL